MDKILKALKKALEQGAITQEEFDTLSTSAKEDYISKEDLKEGYISKEDHNIQVKDRLKRQEEKFKPQLEEVETLKERVKEFEKLEEKNTNLQTELETATGKLAEYEATAKQNKLNQSVDSRLAEYLGDRQLTEPYKKMIFDKINDPDNEEEVGNAVKEVSDLFKQDFPVFFGGGANPNGSQKNFADMSVKDLFSAGLKK